MKVYDVVELVVVIIVNSGNDWVGIINKKKKKNEKKVKSCIIEEFIED